MAKFGGILFLVLIIAGGVALVSSAFVVPETKQVIVTQFGKPVGEAIIEAGLHFKTPFIQDVNEFEKRVLSWDGAPEPITTKDKTYIVVDTFARWRISDVNQYFLRIRDERRALSRLDQILGSETRNAIAKHDLIEVIRTTKDRAPDSDISITGASESIGVLTPIEKGKGTIEEEIHTAAAPKLLELGIELLDIRFKRVNYNETVRRGIYERMISERRQIAERFRSEGAGEAAKIIGKKERDLQEIESEAYKRVQEIRGNADAKATEIYAEAFNQSQDSVEFYEFLKTLESYEQMMRRDTTVVLTTDSDIFKYLKSINPK